MDPVATLYVRNLPPELYNDVKRWAEESGRSVNAEILALLEREAMRRSERGDWLTRFRAFREEGPLSDELGDLAVAAIRAHRDAGF
jgi:hypothetical protein